MALWKSRSPGRTRRLFAIGVLCALVALTGALLLAGREAHAKQPGDASDRGGTNQLGGVAGGGAQNLGNNSGGGGKNRAGGPAGEATGEGTKNLGGAANGGSKGPGSGGSALGDGAGGGSKGLGNGPSRGVQKGLGGATNGGAPGSSGGSDFGGGVGGASGGGDGPLGHQSGRSLSPAAPVAPAPNGPASVTTAAAPAPRPEAAFGQVPTQAPAQVYEAAPVPAATNEFPAPVSEAPAGQVAQPFVETTTPVIGSPAGSPETVIEPVQQVAEPVQEVIGPAVEQANEVAEPAAQPFVRETEPGTRPAVGPVFDPAVRAARLGSTPEADRTAGASTGLAVSPAVQSDAVALRGRAVDLPVRPELAAASPIARGALVLPSATLADPQDVVCRPAMATSPVWHTCLYGLLGRDVFVGERPAMGGTSAAASSVQAPNTLPFGGMPAAVGASGVLGVGSAAGDAGLAVLALLLFLLRAGGSLSWLSLEYLRPNSAPVAITERPG